MRKWICRKPRQYLHWRLQAQKRWDCRETRIKEHFRRFEKKRIRTWDHSHLTRFAWYHDQDPSDHPMQLCHTLWLVDQGDQDRRRRTVFLRQKPKSVPDILQVFLDLAQIIHSNFEVEEVSPRMERYFHIDFVFILLSEGSKTRSRERIECGSIFDVCWECYGFAVFGWFN